MSISVGRGALNFDHWTEQNKGCLKVSPTLEKCTEHKMDREVVLFPPKKNIFGGLLFSFDFVMI